MPIAQKTTRNEGFSIVVLEFPILIQLFRVPCHLFCDSSVFLCVLRGKALAFGFAVACALSCLCSSVFSVVKAFALPLPLLFPVTYSLFPDLLLPFAYW